MGKKMNQDRICLQASVPRNLGHKREESLERQMAAVSSATCQGLLCLKRWIALHIIPHLNSMFFKYSEVDVIYQV